MEANSTMFFPPDNSREWSQIIAFYESVRPCPYSAAVIQLTRRLEHAGFVTAGLHGTTSMFDLILGTAKDVLNNPNLRISPACDCVKLAYFDDIYNRKPWSIEVGYDELYERVKRILIKRVRWFRQFSESNVDETDDEL